MEEKEIRRLIDAVKSGTASRRSFIDRMIGLGLTAPLASQMLLYSGVASAQAASTYKPTKRGGGGPLKLLWWQGATLLNPHFATGRKDQEAARVFYEPLAGWDANGELVPILAAEIPSGGNGGISAGARTAARSVQKQRRYSRAALTKQLTNGRRNNIRFPAFVQDRPPLRGTQIDHTHCDRHHIMDRQACAPSCTTCRPS